MKNILCSIAIISLIFSCRPANENEESAAKSKTSEDSSSDSDEIAKESKPQQLYLIQRTAGLLFLFRQI
jgi:hypothetical protein